MQLTLIDNYVPMSDNSFIMSNSRSIDDIWYDNDKFSKYTTSDNIHCIDGNYNRLLSTSYNYLKYQVGNIYLSNPEKLQDYTVKINIGNLSRLDYNTLTYSEPAYVKCVYNDQSTSIALPVNVQEEPIYYLNYIIDEINRIFNLNVTLYGHNHYACSLKNASNCYIYDINSGFLWSGQYLHGIVLNPKTFTYNVSPFENSKIQFIYLNTWLFSATTIQVIGNNVDCNYNITLTNMM